jgi:hypothetical protein
MAKRALRLVTTGKAWHDTGAAGGGLCGEERVLTPANGNGRGELPTPSAQATDVCRVVSRHVTICTVFARRVYRSNIFTCGRAGAFTDVLKSKNIHDTTRRESRDRESANEMEIDYVA